MGDMRKLWRFPSWKPESQPLMVDDDDSDLSPEDDSTVGKKAGSESWRGVVYCLIASICSVLQTYCVKNSEVPTMDMVAYVGFFQLLAAIPVACCEDKNQPILGERKHLGVLIFRASLGIVTGFTLFYAVQNMPFADASCLSKTFPPLVILFAWFYLQEKPGLIELVTVILTLTGMVLVLRPSFIFGQQQDYNYPHLYWGISMGIMYTVSSAFTSVALRSSGKLSISIGTIIIYNGTFSFVFPSILTFVTYQRLTAVPCLTGRMYIIGAGANALIGQYFYTKAYRSDSAGLIAGIRTADIVFAFILQALFHKDDKILWTSVVGGVMIMLAPILITARRFIVNRVQ